MNLNRRGAIALLGAIASTSPLAQAQTGAIKIVVPFPPGQGADLIMRMIAEPLSKRLNQSVVVDNRPGAGGALGTEYVKNQPADGLTLLMGSSGTLSISPTLQPQAARYNPLTDFEPITGVAAVAQAFVVPANSPYKDLKSFIEAAKANPGKLSFGSSGNGTTQHLFVEAFAYAAGIKLLHVPYKGGTLAFNDMMGGQINMLPDTIPAILQHIKAGTVRALGVTSSARSPLMPDVPTIAEQGLRGYFAEGWITIVAPAGLAPAQADRLDREIRAVMADSAFSSKIRDMGFVEMKVSREPLRSFIASELTKWKTVIAAAGVKAE
jgi:tripartite-type tricarboxylate transporter receptor subunit TctC